MLSSHLSAHLATRTKRPEGLQDQELNPEAVGSQGFTPGFPTLVKKLMGAEVCSCQEEPGGAAWVSRSCLLHLQRLQQSLGVVWSWEWGDKEEWEM